MGQHCIENFHRIHTVAWRQNPCFPGSFHAFTDMEQATLNTNIAAKLALHLSQQEPCQDALDVQAQAHGSRHQCVCSSTSFSAHASDAGKGVGLSASFQQTRHTLANVYQHSAAQVRQLVRLEHLIRKGHSLRTARSGLVEESRQERASSEPCFWGEVLCNKSKGAL